MPPTPSEASLRRRQYLKRVRDAAIQGQLEKPTFWEAERLKSFFCARKIEIEREPDRRVHGALRDLDDVSRETNESLPSWISLAANDFGEADGVPASFSLDFIYLGWSLSADDVIDALGEGVVMEKRVFPVRIGPPGTAAVMEPTANEYGNNILTYNFIVDDKDYCIWAVTSGAGGIGTLHMDNLTDRKILHY